MDSGPTRAIEEFLRVFVAAPLIGRRLTAGTDLGGVTMHKGDVVWYDLGGANRDPPVIDDPQTVDIAGASNRHLTFATGRHRCWDRSSRGRALEVFVDRVADVGLAPGFPPRFEAGLARRTTSLELTLRPAGWARTSSTRAAPFCRTSARVCGPPQTRGQTWTTAHHPVRI